MVLLIPRNCCVLSNKDFEYQYVNRFKVLDDVLNSLLSLNSNNLCHGRLNPNNITIHEESESEVVKYKLRNYGLFCISHSYDLSYDESSYLSPEVILGKECNIESDIWSFGCILYNLITGRRLFHASNVRSLTQKIIKGSYNIGINECNEKEKRLIERLVKVKSEERIKIKNLKENYEKIKDEIFEPDSDDITLHYIEQMAEHRVPIVDAEKLAVIGQKGRKMKFDLFGNNSNVPPAPTNTAATPAPAPAGTALEEEEEEEVLLLDQVIDRFNELEAGDKKDYFFGLLLNLALSKLYFVHIKERIKVSGNTEYEQLLRCITCNDFKPEEFDEDKVVSPTVTLELTKKDGNNNNVTESNMRLTKLFTKILPELSKLHVIEITNTDKETADIILKYITNNLERDNLKRFNKLKVKASYISEDSMKIFGDSLSSSKSKNMRTLYFEDNNIGDNGITYLVSKSCDLINLERLYISNNNITSKGLNILTNSLKYFKHLTALTIAKNKQIDEKSLKRLIKGLKHCKYIDMLCFSELGFTDDVMDDLVKAMNENLLRHLVFLLLNNNEITDKGAKCLINCLGKTREDSVCPKLGILDLNSNNKMKERNITSCVFGKEKPWYEFTS